MSTTLPPILKPEKVPAVSRPLETLGNRLQRIREIRQLSRLEVERQTGISANTLADYEGDRGAFGPPVLRLVELARLYRVSLDWLAGATDDSSLLPAGYVLVDEDVLEEIRSAKGPAALKRLAKTKPFYLVAIPRRWRIYPPDDPDLAAIRAEIHSLAERHGTGLLKRLFGAES